MNGKIDPKYLDRFNMIVVKSKDGGDSLNRVGFYYAALHWNDIVRDTWNNYRWHGFEYSVLALSVTKKRGWGVMWRRHPDLTKWYSDFGTRFSRDQATSIIVALSLYKWTHLLKHTAKTLLKNFSFFTNTRRNAATKENHCQVFTPPWEKPAKRHNYNWKLPDFAGPEIWGLFVRGLNLWYLYPLLLISDLETLLSSISKCFQRDIARGNDVLNHVIVSVFIKRHKYWTPLIPLINYFNKRALLQEKLNHYFRPEHEHAPELAKLYEPLL